MSDYICRRLLFCRQNKTNHQYHRYLPDQYQCRIVITRLIIAAYSDQHQPGNPCFKHPFPGPSWCIFNHIWVNEVFFAPMKTRRLWAQAPANLVSRTRELVTFLRCLQHSFCCVLSQVLLNPAQAASQPLKSSPANHRLSWGWGWTNGRPHTWGLSRRRKKSRGRCVAWLTTQV